jgi:hypothetical protein
VIYLLRHGDAEVARLTGAKAKLRKGGLAVVDGSTPVALLRPRELPRSPARVDERCIEPRIGAKCIAATRAA